MLLLGNDVPLVYENAFCDEMLRKVDIALLLRALPKCVSMNTVIESLRVFITEFVDLMYACLDFVESVSWLYDAIIW